MRVLPECLAQLPVQLTHFGTATLFLRLRLFLFSQTLLHLALLNILWLDDHECGNDGEDAKNAANDEPADFGVELLDDLKHTHQRYHHANVHTDIV